MAWKSPHEVRGVRWLVRMIFQMSSTYSPPRMDLHRRQPQALLVDLAGVGGESAHRLAADLGEVGDVADEPVQLAAVVYRLDHGVLGQVAAAAVGIVVHHHVAGGEVLQSHLGDGPLHGVEDRPDLRRAELGVGDHLRVAVEHHAGEVQPLVEDRGVGGLHHRQPHLAAGVDQVVVDDGEGDAVQRFRHRAAKPSQSCRRGAEWRRRIRGPGVRWCPPEPRDRAEVRTGCRCR